MKKIILAGALAFAAATSYAKAATTAENVVISATEEDNKAKVDPAALPEPIKATLAGDGYKDWKVTEAWAVKADPAPYYTVILQKDDKTTTLNIAEDGKVK